MHDPEKSDSGRVAAKPTNKAGRPAAEPVEPRPGTKGNADQQSTHRTQSRARVTQALDRVRKAARQRKKGQFTALLHHINADTLRTAFYALKRKAAPGVDGITWHDYEADLEPRIEDLHRRVQRGAYRPQPSRRTYIPKADGQRSLKWDAPAASATETSPRAGSSSNSRLAVGDIMSTSMAFGREVCYRPCRPFAACPPGGVIVILRRLRRNAPAWRCSRVQGD